MYVLIAIIQSVCVFILTTQRSYVKDAQTVLNNCTTTDLISDNLHKPIPIWQ